jgi:hypothetical protein
MSSPDLDQIIKIFQLASATLGSSLPLYQIQSMQIRELLEELQERRKVRHPDEIQAKINDIKWEPLNHRNCLPVEMLEWVLSKEKKVD